MRKGKVMRNGGRERKEGRDGEVERQVLYSYIHAIFKNIPDLLYMIRCDLTIQKNSHYNIDRNLFFRVGPLEGFRETTPCTGFGCQERCLPYLSTIFGNFSISNRNRATYT